MNCGSGLFSIYHRIEEILKKNNNIMVAEQVFLNCYDFNPITQSQKVVFKVYYKTLEPEPKFGFVAPWSLSRKKYFRLRNTGSIRNLGTNPGSKVEYIRWISVKK